jgi:hypothetical protein
MYNYTEASYTVPAAKTVEVNPFLALSQNHMASLLISSPSGFLSSPRKVAQRLLPGNQLVVHRGKPIGW